MVENKHNNVYHFCVIVTFVLAIFSLSNHRVIIPHKFQMVCSQILLAELEGLHNFINIYYNKYIYIYIPLYEVAPRSFAVKHLVSVWSTFSSRTTGKNLGMQKRNVFAHTTATTRRG